MALCAIITQNNFKWADGGEAVEWHQDIQRPHTDFSPLTIGVYLDDVDAEMGLMGAAAPSARSTPVSRRRFMGWVMNDSDIASLT